MMRGEVVHLFAFDVANEIDVESTTNLLGRPTTRREVPIEHSYPKETPLYRPVAAAPIEQVAQVGGRPVRLDVRVYEVGVVNLAFTVGFEVADLQELTIHHAARADDGRPLLDIARETCERLCHDLRAAVRRGSKPSDPEAYTIFCLSDLDGTTDVNAWFDERRRAVAGLLCESRLDALSDDQIEESTRIRRSYSRSDLVVVDWDASLVVDLDGRADDVLYVLELANLQLEEYRVMDRRLDRHADQAYRDLEHPQLGGLRPQHRTLAWLRRFRVEVAKLADEVTHITKLLGDWHLARVYLGARERFHLPQWQQSIEQRLTLLDDLLRVVQSDVYERRMLWLEVAVVVCFIVDLLAIFFWKT